MESDPSFGSFEQEMLLPRNSRLEVISVNEVRDKQLMAELMSTIYATSYSCLKIYMLTYKLQV